MIELRDREQPASADRALGRHLPPPRRHLQRAVHRQRRPPPGERARRRRGPRRPGRHVAGGGSRDPRPRRDHRPLHPFDRAGSRRAGRAGRLHQRRPDLGDTDQGGARRATGLELISAAAESLEPSLVRDRGNRHRQRGRGGRAPAPGGSASSGRSATPTTRGGRRLARRPGRRGCEGRAGRGGVAKEERERPARAVLPGAHGRALRAAQCRGPGRPRAAGRGGAARRRHGRRRGRRDPRARLHGLNRDRRGRQRRDRREASPRPGRSR